MFNLMYHIYLYVYSVQEAVQGVDSFPNDSSLIHAPTRTSSSLERRFKRYAKTCVPVCYVPREKVFLFSAHHAPR